MAKTRRVRRIGGGYGTSQQFFDKDILPPAAGMFASVPSTAPTSYEIRPILYSTFGMRGGKRNTRRARKMQDGGFSPSIMGGFIQNAQAAIVPAALYLAYHTIVPKGAKGKSVLRSISRKASKAMKKLSRK